MTALTDEAREKYVRPCPENGVSHDCSYDFIMNMPVEILDGLLKAERAAGAADMQERAARVAEGVDPQHGGDPMETFGRTKAAAAIRALTTTTDEEEK